MFSDAYITIEDGAAAALIEGLNQKLDGSPFEAGNARLLSHSLPFYNGYSLCEISDFSNNPARVISFIYKEGHNSDDIYVLNGTNEPIYSLNKAVPVFLNQDNILTYARFFFYYVRGRFGRFNIVENVDEVNWREEPAPSGRKALSKMIQPLALKPENGDNKYHISSSIIFKDSLFESDIIIEDNGNVTMNNQEMLVEDIPVLDDSLQQ